ncbi:hypothetical protein H5410_062908 [Solanum commersonii]|uniref:Uncharacterized protein n=1 Tax=Solanum commersonii TaxID=4109 RepID=A0A9J5WE30_SOLCO|nr:hypothetical protein H5410_062908 [Solanum commersonii]
MAMLSAKKLIKMAEALCISLDYRVVVLLHYLVIQPSMDYIISLIKKGVATKDLQKALLLSIPSCCCSTSSLHLESGNQQILVY